MAKMRGVARTEIDAAASCAVAAAAEWKSARSAAVATLAAAAEDTVTLARMRMEAGVIVRLTAEISTPTELAMAAAISRRWRSLTSFTSPSARISTSALCAKGTEGTWGGSGGSSG
eukprot:7389580-Prymnesium_polylepis.3